MAAIGGIFFILRRHRKQKPAGTSRRMASTPIPGRTGKRIGSRTPVVVTVIRLTIPAAGTDKSIPKMTPPPIDAPYCISSWPESCLPVKPRVFKIPRFFHSCSTRPEMLCPITAIATPSRTAAKAARIAQNAFWRIAIKPAIVSALWINSAYMESGVFSISSLFISEAVTRPSVSIWIMPPSLASASIPVSSMTEQISS